MINLLPPHQKKGISERRHLVLLFSWQFLIILLLVSFFLTLLVVYVLVEGELKTEKIKLSEIEKEISFYQGFEKKVENFNLVVNEVYSFYRNQKAFSKILEEISQILPDGIYLTNIYIQTQESKKNLVVSLAGFSPTRELLISLKKKLEEKKNFYEVYFPLETWINQENINFNVQFKIK